jgi:hypothetical protein
LQKTAQNNTSTDINQTYIQLKQLLSKNKCQIINENPPTAITVVQGSIWGTTPKTAKKTITFTVSQGANGANINSIAQLTSSYIQFTLVGIVFSLVLLALCTWIAVNLQTAAQTSVWSWLVQINGQLNTDNAKAFANLTGFLAAFLAGTLGLEAYILWKVRAGIAAFAENLAKTLCT